MVQRNDQVLRVGIPGMHRWRFEMGHGGWSVQVNANDAL